MLLVVENYILKVVCPVPPAALQYGPNRDQKQFGEGPDIEVCN
jgi:hypothetical protein